jgi:gamma-glutamylcyclotransferase (GGCT)/AIG2-like uncharacterized protein YtfP
MIADFLFVYGTLRPGHAGPMARRLRAEARHVGPAWAEGVLHRLGDYPGFTPGTDGMVLGDLFALMDANATLAWLDDYEECAAHSPQPHEYRRLSMMVKTPDGPVAAWIYAYARDPSGLPIIADGDFLASV